MFTIYFRGDTMDETKKEVAQHSSSIESELKQLKERLHETEFELSNKSIALIEMTAARNALYDSLQSVQMQLADVSAQRQNDIEAYESELQLRLKEKHQLQEKYDLLVIKAKRYDELQESLTNIKMKAEARALGVIDEAQVKAMDAVNLIDSIEKEIDLFREDIIWLRRDIKVGTLTLDDRLDTLYKRLCANMDVLKKIKNEFYISNNIPFEDDFIEDSSNTTPVIKYPDENQEDHTTQESKVQDISSDTDADNE